jgi:teichuronic acid exporter
MQTENNSNPVSLKKATIINATSKYATVILGLLFSAVLSRLLSPEDYGIVAVVTVFTNFFSLFADMGIGTAVIQNKRLSDDDENRIFTFTLYVGIALFVLFSMFSILLVKIYENTVYYVVGPLLGISLALTTFNMVPNARLMKSKSLFIPSARLH